MNAYVLILLLLFTQWHERGSEKHGQIVLHIYTYAMHDIWQSANSQAAAHCCVRALWCCVPKRRLAHEANEQTNRTNEWVRTRRSKNRWAIELLESHRVQPKNVVLLCTHNNSTTILSFYLTIDGSLNFWLRCHSTFRGTATESMRSPIFVPM